MLRDVISKHGLSVRIELHIGSNAPARYSVSGFLLEPHVARLLVRAAHADGCAIAFRYIHRTATAGPLPTYQN
jgi:hypothetical protein